MHEPDHERIAHALDEARALFAGQLFEHSAPELAVLPPSRAEDIAVLIDGLTSFEAWDLQRTAHGRSRRLIRRAWVLGIRALVPQDGVAADQPATTGQEPPRH